MSEMCAAQKQPPLWGYRYVSLQASAKAIAAIHRAVLSVGAYGNPGGCMPAFFYT